jgi:uncharacterized membrane protein HdeD (DUF308 family)
MKTDDRHASVAMSNGRRRNTATQPHRSRPLPPPARRRPTPLSVVEGAHKIRRDWVASVAFGVGVMVLGFVALGAIGFATLASVSVIGQLLVLAGIMQTTHALRVRKRGGFTRHLLAGLISLVAGVLMLANPAASTRSLALSMAAFFIVAGIFGIAAARCFGFPGRRYAATTDIATVLLGVMIGLEWPMSGVWAVGTLLGIDLILAGWSLVMAGVAARELAYRPSRHLRLARRTAAA